MSGSCNKKVPTAWFNSHTYHYEIYGSPGPGWHVFPLAIGGWRQAPGSCLFTITVGIWFCIMACYFDRIHFFLSSSFAGLVFPLELHHIKFPKPCCRWRIPWWRTPSKLIYIYIIFFLLKLGKDSCSRLRVCSIPFRFSIGSSPFAICIWYSYLPAPRHAASHPTTVYNVPHIYIYNFFGYNWRDKRLRTAGLFACCFNLDGRAPIYSQSFGI